MLLQKFRNVVFASIIVDSLASCANQGANDNSMQESSKNRKRRDFIWIDDGFWWTKLKIINFRFIFPKKRVK